jgi:hypothetical protein
VRLRASIDAGARVLLGPTVMGIFYGITATRELWSLTFGRVLLLSAVVAAAELRRVVRGVLADGVTERSPARLGRIGYAATALVAIAPGVASLALAGAHGAEDATWFMRVLGVAMIVAGGLRFSQAFAVRPRAG